MSAAAARERLTGGAGALLSAAIHLEAHPDFDPVEYLLDAAVLIESAREAS